jgi:hypothetical protein
MFFGGIHFFGGLFSLILSWLVVSIWLEVLLLIIPCLLLFWQKLSKKQGSALSRTKVKKIALAAFGAALILHIVVYVTNRIEWCSEDNANFKAKEYFVAGQPLAGLRLVLTRILNPDSALLLPLNATQWLMYKQGIRYLPENDGEIGVWSDLWFNYPYIGVMHVPYGTNKTEPSLKMRKLLDRIWFSMEAMSTKPFADLRMKKKNYFLNFPRSAFYYTQKSAYYHDRFIGAAPYLLQDPKYVARDKVLADWILQLRQRWIAAGSYEEIKKIYPKIEAMRQVVAIRQLGKVIETSIYPGEFSCQDHYIPLYVDARREFADEKDPNHVLKKLRLKQKRQAEDLFAIGVEGVSTGFHKYILKKYCGIDVFGAGSFGYKNREADQREVTNQIKRLFRNELKILEEGRHE